MLVNYAGNRRQLNRFIWRLLKQGFKFNATYDFQKLKLYTDLFKNECSVQVFRDKSFSVLNYREENLIDSFYFNPKQFNQALSYATKR